MAAQLVGMATRLGGGGGGGGGGDVYQGNERIKWQWALLGTRW